MTNKPIKNWEELKRKYLLWIVGEPAKQRGFPTDEEIADWWIAKLSEATREAMREERERIVSIVEKWMKTSNPAYAQDLFDALHPKDPITNPKQ